MKDLIKYIAQALVDHPEKVEVLEVKGNRISVIELKVAKRIWGRLSGSRAAMLKPYGSY